MRNDLKTLADNVPNGRTMARYVLIQERIEPRVAESNLDNDIPDLNPHLQVVHIADQIVADVRAEGFEEVTREEVYLMMLTKILFPPFKATTAV